MNMETQLDLADESQAVSEQGDSTQVNTKTMAKTDSAKATKKAVKKTSITNITQQTSYNIYSINSTRARKQ